MTMIPSAMGTARKWLPWLTLLLCGSPAAEELVFRFESRSGEPISDVVVTAGPTTSPVEDKVAVMDQVDKAFQPYVLPIRIGTEISFPNSDQIRHHVYSFSAAKRFEIRLYHGEPGETVTFDEPGVVALGCNIHDNMVGYVYVTEAAAFGKTDNAGEVRIETSTEVNTIKAWHPALSFDARQELELQLAEMTREGNLYVISLDIDSPPANPQAIEPGARDRFKQYMPE